MKRIPKLTWRVDPAPTGPYRSFSHRAWPSADYPNGKTAACIISADKVPYEGFHRKETCLNLKVRIAKWIKTDEGTDTFVWVVSRRSFSTIAEAKEGVNKLLESNPHLMHPEYRNEI